MRSRTVVALGAVAVAVLLARAALLQAPRQNVQRASSAAPRENVLSLRVVFGYRRTAVKPYSGSMSVTGGSLRRLQPWRFLQDDAITGPDSWKLTVKRIVFENQPDAPNQMSAGGPAPLNIVPAGVIATIDAGSSSAEFRTDQGNFTVPVRELVYGRELWYLDGDVLVERVPTSERVSPQNAEQHDYPSIAVTRAGHVFTAWQAYQDRGDHVYVRIDNGQPVQLTTQKGDVFRTSVAEDGDGSVHVAWSERSGVDWNLYERVFDGANWSASRAITSGPNNNNFHKFISGPRSLHVIWVGHEGGVSYLYLSAYTRGSGWSQPQRIGGPSVWNPTGASDRDGNLHVAWDSYQTGNYDIFYRRIGADGTPDSVEQITKSPRFEAHPSVAVDAQGRPWLAWDQSGANWGKDWTHDDPYRSTVLYRDRSIRVAVKDSGQWKEAPDFSGAVPERLRRYWQLPHLASDSTGRIWAVFQMRTDTANQRNDFWGAGARWDYYVATIDGGVWRPAALIP